MADVSDVNQKICENGIFERRVERRYQFSRNVRDEADLKRKESSQE